MQGLDRERAAVGHRVAGVDREVDHHLLELRAVGEHGREAVGGEHRDLDVAADQPAEHRHERARDLVEVEQHRLQHLPACERQQLPGQRRGALGRALDLLELVRPRPRADPVAGDLRVAADDRQQVVEVVRDPARELADRLHLLRLAELVLEHPPLGDVAQHEQVPVGRELRRRADLEHQPPAVLLTVPDVLQHPLGDPVGRQEPVPVGPRALLADELVELRPISSACGCP